MKIKNLAQFCEHYKENMLLKDGVKKGLRNFGQFMTGITRLVAPALGHPAPQGKNPTNQEKEELWQFLETIPIVRLKDFLDLSEQYCETHDVPVSSQKTYTSRIRAALRYAEEQPWYSSQLEGDSKNHAPVKQRGFGSIQNCRVTDRSHHPNYYLAEPERKEDLKKQVAKLIRFYGKKFNAKRESKELGGMTIENYEAILWRLLGFHHHILGVPLEELSLETLVVPVEVKGARDPIAAQKAVEEAADALDEWFCEYLNFLFDERGVTGYGGAFNTALAIYALVRFFYCREFKDPTYQSLVIFHRSRQRISDLAKKMAEADSVSNEDKKWLPLPIILEEIVTPLRLECGYRNSSGALKPITTITADFQRFLVWYMLTARPPRRQRIFRELRMAMSCPITRPEGVRPDQVIHPLPEDRMRHKNNSHLYKAADGKWYIDLQAESHKKGDTHGAQTLVIPNHQFNDGHCAYDYLEAFLYGYYRDEKGNWLSGGQLVSTPAVRGQWFNLRMGFELDHNFVFFKSEARQPHDKSSISKLVATAAHRLTGKSVTPHLLRNIYITWFLDQGATDAQVHALAYAMGHTVETLRKIYDRRRSQQKLRPIEEEMLKLLDEYLD